MTLSLPTEEAPHIAAIDRSRRAGFRFLHLPSSGAVEAIHAQRRIGEVVETYAFQGLSEAVAARYRLGDYPSRAPAWQRFGTVEEVVNTLLELPPHDSPAAPRTSRRASSALWLPWPRE